MLATLQTVAQQEGIDFRYGTLPEENQEADDSPVDGDYLFQEGYLSGTLKLNNDNSLTLTYSVTLWYMAQSKLADRPEDRGPELLRILNSMVRIYRKLGGFGELSPAQFQEGINLLDRNVDGMRLKFTFTPFTPLTVC